MSDEKKDVCAVCTMAIAKSESFITPCDHEFHKACLQQWLRTCESQHNVQTCPLCRRDLQSSLDRMTEDNRADYLNYSESNGVDIQHVRRVCQFTSQLLENVYQMSPYAQDCNLQGVSNRFMTAFDNRIANANERAIPDIAPLILGSLFCAIAENNVLPVLNSYSDEDYHPLGWSPSDDV